MTRTRSLQILFSVVIVSFTLAIGFYLKKTIQGPTFGGDFSLTYRNQPWTFSSAPKKLNLIYFGYTKCPDVCPMSLSFAGQAFRKLNEKELNQVRFIFLSVDQSHDNPDDVADYAQNFFPAFLGLSGSQVQIDAAIKLFPASYMYEENPKSYLGYSISHTDRIFLVDQDGLMLDSIPGSKEGADQIYNKIKEYL